MNFITRIAQLAENRVNKYGAQYYTFALFTVLHYPLSYYYEVSSGALATNFWIRFVPIVLCMILLLKNKWPKKYQKFVPLFWYIAVTVSIPILASYQLLNNNFSTAWLVNFNVGIVIIILLLDWLSFLIVELIGTSLGVMLFYFSGNELIDLPDNDFFPLFYYMLFWIIVCGILFNRNKEVTNHYLQKTKDKLNDNLSGTVIELKKAISAKTEFLSNISQEISAPITGFTTISNSLYEDWYDFNEEKRRELAHRIATSAKRLGSLLGNLLDLSKLYQGKMLIFPSNFDLSRLVKDVIEECNTLYMSDKNINIIFNNEDSFPVFADKGRIAQVLRNLFVNAIKFSEPGSKIEAKLLLSMSQYEHKIKKEAMHFVVIDQGKGVPEEELDDIFQPFIQSSRTKTGIGGTGLGLTICREIIDAHMGKIWAQNNEDKGSSFHFIIPITKDETALKINPSKNYILLVDDESYCLTSLESILIKHNYNLLKASNGKMALEVLDQHRGQIDLIILDLMMPGIDGVGVLTRINGDKGLKKIPVIIQTGSSDEKIINKARDLGVVSFVSKPHKTEKVMDEVVKYLRDPIDQYDDFCIENVEKKIKPEILTEI